MKPVAMLLTVILLVIGTFFIAGSFTTKKKAGTAEHGSDLILTGVLLKKEQAGPAPQTHYKEATLPKATKLKLTKPKTGTIQIKSSQCGVVPPLPEEDYNDSIIVCYVPIEAEYPGGAAAWQRYLNKNLRYPQEAIDNEIQGSVVVQFVVDKEGNVSNVEKLSGPDALGAEAVRVITKSGKWIPAVQGGRYVKSLRKQPFIVHFETEE